MQTNPEQRTYSGLIAVLGLLALIVGFTVMLVLPETRWAAWGILGLGIILLATAFVLDYRRVSRAITGKRGRFSTGTTVMASIFIGIILLVNTISIGSYHRFDITGVAQFTLTSQTKDVLTKLEAPIEAICFFVPNDPYGITTYATGLLNEYQNYANNLTVETIDPDEHPDQAREYGITHAALYQSVVFQSQDKRRLVMAQEIVEEAEHAFTSAILEVTGIVQKKIYFLTGHGEVNVKSDASDGYSRARDGLREYLYQVGTLDLLLTPRIPEDCAALIIAGPQKSFSSNEIEVLESYLENNGWLMILANPNPPSEIKQLLSSWGVLIEDGTIIDTSDYVVPSIDSPKVPRIRNFFGLSETYFPGTTAIIPQPEYTPQAIPASEGTLLQIAWSSEDSELELYSLARTSPDSWLEKDFNPNEEPELDEGIDLKGPLNIGFLITQALTEEAQQEPLEVKDTRIVVFGDSDFASNQHFYNGNNAELFLNSVNLLTVGKELISIERKVLPFRRLVVGPEAGIFINYSSIGLLPLLVLVAGGIIWWRRR